MTIFNNQKAMKLPDLSKSVVSRSQEPKFAQQKPPQAELTSILNNTARNLGRLPNLPIDKLILHVQTNAIEGFSRIVTDRLQQHNLQVDTLLEHIHSIDRDLKLLDNPSLRLEVASEEINFSRDQIRSQMLLNQDQILAPNEGIVSEEVLEEAKQRESRNIEIAKERLDFFTQQIQEARHPRQPMISPRSYIGATVLALLLIFCLNGVLAKFLDLTQIEMVLLSTFDVACILGMMLVGPDKTTEQTLSKQELRYESQNLRAAS